MKKPDDYDIYFNPDGSEKEVPDSVSFTEKIRWCRRQMVILLALMSEEEREKFLARRRSSYWRKVFEIPLDTLLLSKFKV